LAQACQTSPRAEQIASHSLLVFPGAANGRAILKRFNQGLERLRQSGQYDQIMARHIAFGSCPPRETPGPPEYCADRLMSRRPPALPVTPERLEQAALRYLGRYASSSANLRRVLLARVQRSARDHDTDPEQGAAWVAQLIQRFQGQGWLDDASFAATKSASWRRGGRSARAIGERLAGAGVEAELARAALAETDSDLGPEAELAAALAWCRKRRLGPYRAEGERERYRQKDLAALGRAGFDYHTAKIAIEAKGDGGPPLEPPFF